MRPTWRPIGYTAVCTGIGLTLLSSLSLAQSPPHSQGGAASAPVAGAQRSPIDVVPAESMLTWYGKPFPGGAAPSDAPSALGALLDVGTRLAGVSDGRGQLAVRGVELIGLMVRYPYAIAIVDASAKPVEADQRSRRIDDLKLLLAVDVGRDPGPFRRTIQKVVNEQTGRDYATLELREAHGLRFQELRDKRLPAWCVLGWGEIDNLFVLAIGEGVWESAAGVAAGRRVALSADEWVKTVRSAARDPLLEIVVSAARMKERLDPLVQGRVTDFFEAWSAGAAERAHWAMGFEQQALFCVSHIEADGATRERVYADPATDRPALRATAPPGARYAIYTLPLREITPRFFQSLSATRGRHTRELIDEWWAELEQKAGFDTQKDLLDHLGEHAMLHNYPPHPLQLPLSFTMLAEISGDARRVHQTLTRIMTGYADYLVEAEESNGKPNMLQLQADADGIWYMQFGIVAGLAVTVTEKYVITSWSPQALREYLSAVDASRRGAVLR